ncbi:hypothetical protein BDN70DRAFT_936259 [Pholiota conissans]|uniref:Peptidase C14 caspase domain-containing protein n=1 Tax=Pholiota conissans TaxID=109636 RepID=A0A9P6CWV3_9AGAR|nr:hypothetical protein BDN70DRAFT_936259 [Pholiota conissans]
MTYYAPSVIDHRDILNQLWKRSNSNFFANAPPPSQSMPRGKIGLHAVLIGINSYQASNPAGQFPNLRGAVPDAYGFQSYLENVLGVPHNQIVLLINEDATRDAIVKTLRNLREDPRIDRDDAILIYYAGHGIEIDPPPGWEVGDPKAKIQAIVPYDCDIYKTNGQRVAPIPDRSLEVLLSKIAEKKGDNITVIFDCCHAASGTRSSQARSIEIPDRVYSDLDSDIIDAELARSAKGSSKFMHRGLGSHILLAACNPVELAIEGNGHGRFSAALLKLLNKVPAEQLCYSTILAHPLFERIPNQSPQCEGLNLDRTLFNSKAISLRKCFPVTYDQKANNGHGQHVVQGGTINNIRPEDEFYIYRESDSQLAHRIGTLYVDQLNPFFFRARLLPGAPAFDLTQPTIAIQRRLGPKKDLQIQVPPEDKFRLIYRDLVTHPALKADAETISLIDQSADAHIRVRSQPGRNVVEMTLRTLSVANVPAHYFKHYIDTDPNILARTICQIAHFYRELKCVDNDPRISRCIGIEFYRLQETFEFNEQTRSEEELYETVGPNLYVNGVINVIADKDEEIPYGIKITNGSLKDLHANVLFFNNSDLSIVPFVKPNAAVNDKSLEVPLVSGGSLAIGYGSAGYPAVSFEIAKELDVDVGFLKIYLSTQPVNMAYVPQKSPFVQPRGIKEHQPTKRPVPSWTDIVIPVIQSCRR